MSQRTSTYHKLLRRAYMHPEEFIIINKEDGLRLYHRPSDNWLAYRRVYRAIIRSGIHITNPNTVFKLVFTLGVKAKHYASTGIASASNQ